MSGALLELIVGRNALLTARDGALVALNLDLPPWMAAIVEEKTFPRDLLVELARQNRPPTPLVSTEVEIAGRLRAVLDLLDTHAPDWGSIATILLGCLQAIEDSR